MGGFWGELKRRNVVRVAVGYAVVGWLILQLTDVLLSLLSLPIWVGRLVFLLLLVGLPVAVFFAWAYELTPEGLKKEKEVQSSASPSHVNNRKLDFIIIGVLTLAVTVFAVERFLLLPNRHSDTSDFVETADSRQSIAVLPFVNMSDDPANEYFSDGLSEEILNLLAKIQDLKVIARTSSFAFKGKNEDVRMIGAALGVKTVLEGSVRKAGNRVRVTAQLIETAGGAHLWSESYDRNLTDIFAVQDDVAAAIIDALHIHVGAGPSRGNPTQSTEAYTLFLRAKSLVNVGEFRDGEEVLRNAIAIDPDFAEAYESLALIYWFIGGQLISAEEGQRLMGEAAANALAIDPDLVFAQALYEAGNIESYSYLKELEAFERAAREEPGNAGLLDLLSYDLLQAGYLQEGLDVANRNVELDPLSPVAHSRRADALWAMGRMEEAIRTYDMAGQFGNREAAKIAAYMKLFWLGDDSGITQLESSKDPVAVALWAGVRDLIAAARDPSLGEAYLERRIPEILASMPAEDRFEAEQFLSAFYLDFGFLDRYYQQIFAYDLTASSWTDADILIYIGTVSQESGFTAHPKYLEVAELIGLIDIWEKRGPPDLCTKADGQWVCK